uniref:C3H1-type domain-containing protein n=1 Tax=Oryza punctata TaxID=4537 RepID=A0A0E0JIF6_ORYPU
MAYVTSDHQLAAAAAAEFLAALQVHLAGGEGAPTWGRRGGSAYDEDFMMYEFKVRRCPRSRAHEWTSCPYAHPGEAARRRDPSRVTYTGEPCPDFRVRPGAACPRGSGCPFAHGTFETWLHPSRYRTRACRSGMLCARPICFFAHNDKELRIVGNDAVAATPSPRSPFTTWENSPPPSPTDVTRQPQPDEQGSMQSMDMKQIVLAMQQLDAMKAMRSVAPTTDMLPQELEEDAPELGWVSDLLM